MTHGVNTASQSCLSRSGASLKCGAEEVVLASTMHMHATLCYVIQLPSAPASHVLIGDLSHGDLSQGDLCHGVYWW